MRRGGPGRLPAALWLTLVIAGAPLACSRAPSFQGDALDTPRPILDFSLLDQAGRRIRLSDLHGRVVVLTFLYTSCPDLCPLTTQKLHEVSEMLGTRRADVALLAVTVDPARDTMPRRAEYSRRWQMQDRWHFLTGSETALEPLWRYYWVGEVSHGPTSGDGAYEVDHASPLHLIDRDGRVRVVYNQDFSPAQLAHDIGVLIDGG
jgi:protein SCO1/2